MTISRIRMTVLGLFTAALLGWAANAASTWPSASAQPPQTPTQPPKIVSDKPGDVEKPNQIALPLSPMPTQALARMDAKSRLSVQLVMMVATPITTFDDQGQPHTRYEHKPQTTENSIDASEVRAFNTQGNMVDTDTLKKTLTKQTLVLVTTRFDPLHLRVLKEGTLILVLPVLPMAQFPALPPPVMPGAFPGAAIPPPPVGKIGN